MKYLFVAPNLTAPTFETLQETTYQVFSKIEEFLRKINQTDCTIKISVAKEGNNNFYKINVEIIGFKKVNPIVILKDSDLRRAIGFAAKKVRKQIIEKRERMRK